MRSASRPPTGDVAAIVTVIAMMARPTAGPDARPKRNGIITSSEYIARFWNPITPAAATNED